MVTWTPTPGPQELGGRKSPDPRIRGRGPHQIVGRGPHVIRGSSDPQKRGSIVDGKEREIPQGQGFKSFSSGIRSQDQGQEFQPSATGKVPASVRAVCQKIDKRSDDDDRPPLDAFAESDNPFLRRLAARHDPARAQAVRSAFRRRRTVET